MDLYDSTPLQEGRNGYKIVGHTDSDKYTLLRKCPFCGQQAHVAVPAQGLWDWEHGQFVQVAMPGLTPDEREIVMTGTHPACFDAVFADDEDYDPQGEDPNYGPDGVQDGES